MTAPIKKVSLNWWRLTGDCGPKIAKLQRKGYSCLVTTNVSTWEWRKIQNWFKNKGNEDFYLSKRIFFNDDDIHGTNCELVMGFPQEKQAKKFEVFLRLLPKRSFDVYIPDRFNYRAGEFGIPKELRSWIKKNAKSNSHVLSSGSGFIASFSNEEDAILFKLIFS